ncbi:TonB-dependent receptor [Aquimarina muelleri]|uniref:TonB-dependent receptor n=1 Tax=Aquimarina muelleri TaxID=279356 RepID=UPI003F6868E1
MSNYRLLIIAVFLLSYCSSVNGQNTVSGRITSETGERLAFASVHISDTGIGINSDEQGGYTIQNIPDGKHKLIISSIGYHNIEKVIFFQGKPLIVNFVLKEKTSTLDEVVVAGKSQAQKIREIAYKPEVVELENTLIKTTPVIDVIGQLPGVSIRKQGGLGSDANIMLNGISGKGVRTFIDGIPVDLLGQGFQLNNLSSNIIKRIEVYKGVVPVTFGADALGGVINVVTANRFKNYLDVSYSAGSWNTHQTTIGLKRYLDKKNTLFIQMDGFFNHSDNDYWMYDVDVIADNLGNTKKGDVRRFNDAFTSHLGRFQFGVQQVSWADDFRLMFSFSKSKKEWQHGISAELPWGEVYSKNQNVNGVLSWKKKSSDRKLKFSVMIGYNFINEKFIDVSDETYLWDGTTFPKNNKGESGYYIDGRTPDIDIDNIFSRATIDYRLADQHKINFTSFNSYEQIKGEDKAGASTFKKDIYTTPQKLTKIFIGTSLESSFFENKLTNILSGKYYYGKSHVVSLKIDNSIDRYIENRQQTLGYGNVFKYKISSKISAFAGYEYAVRLPDKSEIFGDGITIGPSANLKLEESHNINFGIAKKNENSELSINGFYRKTSNKIFLSAVSQGLSAYLNLFATETKGIEGSYTINPLNNFSIYANATWQHTTLKDVDVFGKIDARYIGAGIPNTPYLFANFGASYTFENFLQKNSKTIINYNNNYVNEFFLAWENDGTNASKAKIPTQFTHNTSISYAFPKDKYSLSLECRNLTNARAFDNYKVQKPGRSFYLKIRMYLN